MNTLKDKVIGSYYGMALGNAMGLSSKSLKPETIRQLFSSMDNFKDVSPFIGKGVKKFKMKGLYGYQAQSALVIGDSLLKNKKKADPRKISQLFLKMTTNGPEHYFGTFRHPGKGFYQSVESLTEGLPRIPRHDIADASFLSMGIPAGLLHRERPEAGLHSNIAIGLMMSRNLSEITGLALTGYLASRLLQLEHGQNDDLNRTEMVLKDAEIFCQKVEARLRESAPNLWNSVPESEHGMLEQTIKTLREKWNIDFNELLNWVCKNASEKHGTKITNPAQGYVLTLLPLCLIIVLRKYCGFDSTVTSVLNMGKESDKTGVLVGTWAGSIYGWREIPEPWRSGLVNGKEIRLRGEGLFSGSFPKDAKDIYEMELGLTLKEFEVGKKYFEKGKKFSRPTPRPTLSWEDADTDESNIPEKSDVANWRKFEKDKSRTKKNRRKNLRRTL